MKPIVVPETKAIRKEVKGVKGEEEEVSKKKSLLDTQMGVFIASLVNENSEMEETVAKREDENGGLHHHTETTALPSSNW